MALSTIPVATAGLILKHNAGLSLKHNGGRKLQSSFFKPNKLSALFQQSSSAAVPKPPKQLPTVMRMAATKKAYICRDCGYIYNERLAFEKQPDNFYCPVCGAPKRRFKPYTEPVSRDANDIKIRKARKQQLQEDNFSFGDIALPLGISFLVACLVIAYFYLSTQS